MNCDMVLQKRSKNESRTYSGNFMIYTHPRDNQFCNNNNETVSI